jgi:hypothetical protein
MATRDMLFGVLALVLERMLCLLWFVFLGRLSDMSVC